MSENVVEMKKLSDFMPKTKTVLVGDKELILSELTIAKRDAVIQILMSSAGVVDELIPAIQSMREKATEDGLEFLAGLKGVLVRVLGKELTRISCLALDSRKNRELLGIKADVAFDEFGVEACPVFISWVKDSLTVRQEQLLIDAIFEVNDFAELLKKYLDLLIKGFQAVGPGAATEPEKEATQA